MEVGCNQIIAQGTTLQPDDIFISIMLLF